tara:strand:+ start:353 stop:556 length:204 start_codon:yes stop_codon:yes gene_type:complete
MVVFAPVRKSTVSKGKLITLVAVVLLLILIVLANRTQSPSGGVSVGSKDAPVGLEKELPNKKKIPTH